MITTKPQRPWLASIFFCLALVFLLLQLPLDAQTPTATKEAPATAVKEGTKITPPESARFVINPAFKPDQTPAPDQPLDLTKSKERADSHLATIEEAVATLCKKKDNSVFRIQRAKSTLKVTAFKNYQIPVVSKIAAFDGLLYWSDKRPLPKATLFLDNTSWDSGVPERDNRVKHFLLKADLRKFAVSEVILAYTEKAALTPGLKDTPGTLSFRGEQFSILAKSDVAIGDSGWIIKSAEPLRLHARFPKADLLGIMTLCNHESISPSVDLEWDLLFESACK